MTALRDDVDPDGLLEYSVVYTDRALNHMSMRFIAVMQDLVSILKAAYHAETVAFVPGSGTSGMEAVARQFAHDRSCLILRNGYFSYRWSQIIDAGSITKDVTVLPARPVDDSPTAPWAPAPIEEVVAAIRADEPAVVFAPHVETASGIILPDDYLRAVAEATREVGGLFVLDCIASGAMWVDMAELGIDLLISAPQKGWSGSPSAAFVMFGPRARTAIEGTTSSSFALDLFKWLTIAEGYVAGAAAYHTTMPTDALAHNAEIMAQTRDLGFEEARRRQVELGRKVRDLLAGRGYASVAAPGFEAPGVVVSYTDDPAMKSGRKFIDVGIQAAAGVPLMCDEGADFSTFRVGLFGLDKWADVDGAVARLAAGLDAMAG